jgi:hypothetical protein
MAMFIVTIKGEIEIGFEIPRRGYNVLMNNPMNIRKEMLNPADNTNFSVEPILSNFRTCRINNPGKIMRKRNPTICLKKGMFKRMTTSAEISSPMENKKKFLASKLLRISIIFI